MQRKWIEEAEIFVKNRLSSDCSGHDWFHIDRVRKLALHIAESEQSGNLLVIELAALLHDIPDYKLNQTEKEGWLVLNSWFANSDLEDKMILEITKIIHSISFSKGIEVLPSVEAKIVQDADRLDAIGAIGIARAFTYGGKKGRPLYNPSLPLTNNKIGNEQEESSSIHHFYEKLLRLTDRLHTKTAKAIATERHRYMEEFLKQFYKEWDVHI